MGKNIKDENLVVNIIFNGDAGRRELNELDRAIIDTRVNVERLKKEQVLLTKEGKADGEQFIKNREAIAEYNKVITAAQQRMRQIRQGMSLTELTMSDLRREEKRLRIQLNTAVPGTDSWRNYRKELAAVQGRITELKASADTTGLSMNKMASGINRYIGLATAAAASLFSFMAGVDRAKDKYAEHDDKMADVIKTTKLTKEQVKDLNAELQNVDTRTAQNQMLDLARIAGKLGIEGKKNVEGFTKAADQINVALAEDLGGNAEEAIGMIGKLTTLFNISDLFGIEKGVLKVGSAINTLGASSVANEEFIVRFSSRIGGVGKSANMSIQDILGLAATLDALGQRSEISSTAISRIIMGMFDDTAAYANVAGMSLANFSNILQTDVNDALIAVLKGMDNDGGLQTVIQKLDEVGINGTEAATVLSAVAQKTDLLAKQQEIANKAFTEGTSITDEFNTKNTTVQAEFEKRMKRVTALTVELGEKLMPLSMASADTYAYLLRTLKALVGFIIDNRKELTALTLALGGYLLVVKSVALYHTILSKVFHATTLARASAVIAIKAQNAILAVNKANILSVRAAKLLLSSATSLLTGNVAKANKEFKLFSSILKLPPLGWVATAIGVVSGAIYLWNNRSTDAIKIQKNLNEITDKALDSASDQIGNMRKLLTLASDKVISDERRKTAMEDLQKIMPHGIDLINEETIATGKAKTAVDEYIKVLLLKAKIQASEEKLQSIAKQQFEDETEGNDRKLSFWQKIGSAMASHSGGKFLDLKKDQEKQNAIDYQASMKIQTDAIAEYISELQKQVDLYETGESVLSEVDVIMKDMQVKSNHNLEDAGFKEKEKKDKPNPVLGKSTNEAKKEKFIDLEYDADRIRIKKAYFEGAIKSETDYQRQLLQAEIASLERRLSSEKTSADDRSKVEADLYDKRRELRKMDTDNAEKVSRAYNALADTDLQKEQRRYDDEVKRLSDLGMTRQTHLKAYEALDEEHRKNIDQIENKAIADEIERRQNAFEEIIASRKYAHDLELSQFKGAAEDKKQLSEEYARQDAAFAADHLKALAADLQQLIDSGMFAGIDNVILSEEQKEALTKRLREVGSEILHLNEKTKGADEKDSPSKLSVEAQTVDVLGLTAKDWEQFFNHIKDGKIGIEDMVFAAKALSNAYRQYNDYVTASENAQLRKFERDNQRKKRDLQNRLNSGKMSHESYNAKVAELDDELDKKKDEIELKQAKRNKTQAIFDAMINTAVAITSALKTPWLWPIVSALGAAQIAAIIATPLPGKEDGGYIDVQREQDGRRYRAAYDPDKRGFVDRPTVITGESGREYILPAEALENPTVAPLISTIETARITGRLKTLNLARVLPGRAAGGLMATDTPFGHSGGNPIYAYPTDDGRTAAALAENSRVMTRLSKQLDAGIFVSLTGKNGFLKQSDRYERIKKRATIGPKNR